MKRTVRHPFVLTTWLVLVVVALGANLQPKPASAAVAWVTLAATNQDWSYGRFFRTGLAASASGGGVQLIPAKVHSQYEPKANPLPIPLSGHASVTYRDRIFVVGGNTRSGTTSSLRYRSAQFFSARLADQATGTLTAWQTLPPLPEETTNPQNLNPPPRFAVSDAAAVVVEVAGKPYLFVLGGYLGRDRPDSNLAQDTVTTSRIFYFPLVFTAEGNVDASQVWREIDNNGRLPFLRDDINYENISPPIEGSAGAGARDLGAVSVVVNNQPWIYTFGGNSRTVVVGTSRERYSSRVNRAKVLPGANGTLTLEWQDDFANADYKIRGVDVQEAFLADAATVKSVDPNTGNTGVYVIGGKRCATNCHGENNTDEPAYTDDANAYVVRINGATGSLMWLTSGDMSAGRYGHAAFETEGQINISGGRVRTSADALPTFAEGYVNYPELDLYQEDSAASFIHENGPLGEDGRVYHTMETLDGGMYGDWAYILGGAVGAAGNQLPVSSDVLVGNIDTPPLTFDRYVASGNYYSKTFDYGANARFFRFRWTAVDEAGSPIQMLYRYSLADGSMTDYMPIPASTPVADSAGRLTYTYQFPNVISSRYFQFMAKLARPALQSSPRLQVSQLEVERAGYPSIKVAPGGASMMPREITRTGSIAPVVPLVNTAYQKSTGEIVPALPANWDGEGSFFLVLYLQGPNQPRPPFGAPVIGTVEPVAYAMVQKASLPVMSPGQQFLVPPTTWYSYADGSAADTAFWRGLFRNVGEYTLHLVVDATDDARFPRGLVHEALEPGVDGESDNVSSFTVTVVDPLKRTYVPLAHGSSSSTVKSAQVPVTPHGLPKLP
ncbi:MAG: hypothetical protein M3R24_00795 [Chloroflexota bacterium]|nr:hypothetical protein [Chloroflexota bacterium]